MDVPYPQAPEGVPADLTVPSARYRRHTWAAVAALLAFVGVYGGLTAWLGSTAWRLFTSGAGLGLVLGLPAAFLTAFLLKGLFFVRKGEVGDAIEVRPEEEPALFAFLDRLAAETGTRRPHRVFLTPDVNAAVFYDLSLLNLLLPSRKNLQLGLGLVNVLTLDELKAVLAHELGHFAQRTMAVGSWVYISRQAITAIVERRDIFDKILDAISRIDLRVAWIGWGMKLLVWSVRVVLDTAFRGLLLAQRALSREMEFQADLVAVSVTGSDSLVHALRRMTPADDALNRAFSVATQGGRKGAPILDLYAVQTSIIGQLRKMWHDPTLGAVPVLPEAPASHRLFRPDIAEVPRMWRTHPPSWEREENAKRRYIRSPLDTRSAWVIFKDEASLRRDMTGLLYRKNMPDAAEKPAVALEATLGEVETAFGRPALDPAWRGVYVGRSVVRGVRTAAELVGPLPTDAGEIRARLAQLYPAEIVDTLKQLRVAREELAQLEALQRGVLTTAGGVVQFRGRSVPRAELPALVEQVTAEVRGLEATVARHDLEVRTAHRAAAAVLGEGWEPWLAGLLGNLHYFDHVAAELADVEGVLDNVFAVVTADGRVSADEIRRLVDAGNQVHGVLEHVYAQAPTVHLGEAVRARLDGHAWVQVLGESFKLIPATREGLAENWLQAAATWVRAAAAALDRASDATLDELLTAERTVRAHFESGEAIGVAPSPPQRPWHYPTLIPGEERPRQSKLGAWERFVLADGWGPGLARLAAAGLILVPASLYASHAGTAEVIVHNGLARAVIVDVGEVHGRLAEPHTDLHLRIQPSAAVAVSATTEDGVPIESFTESADNAWFKYVYDVASADTFVKQWVAYGDLATPPYRFMGAVRWRRGEEDYVLEDPPKSIDAKQAELRSWLMSLQDASVATRVRAAGSTAGALVSAHLRWDPVTDPQFSRWAAEGPGAGVDVASILVPREDEDPVGVGRLLQDAAHGETCERHRARSAAAPADLDLAYLAWRCDADTVPEPEATAALDVLLARGPDHPWLRGARATASLERGDWAEASERYAALVKDVPAFGPDCAASQAIAAYGEGQPRGDVLQFMEAEARKILGPLLAADAGEQVQDVPDAMPSERARILLAGGNLDDAWQLVEKDPDAGAVRGLIAVSGDATPAMIRGYFEQKDPLPALNCAWSVALGVRIGVDWEEVANRCKLPAEERAQLAPIFQAKAADVPKVIAELGARLPLRGRARLKVIGLIRLGDAAPAEWVDEVRSALFPVERPYFRRR